MKANFRTIGLALSILSFPGLFAANVNSPSFSELSAAIALGGYVRLNFSGTVQFQNAITISRDVEIDGTGRSVTFYGNGSDRLFSVTNVTLKLKSIALSGGKAPVSKESRSAFGGAIALDSGRLLAENCYFQANWAKGMAGEKISPPPIPVFTSDLIFAGRSRGGAIFARNSEVRLVDSSFFGNFVSGPESQWVQSIFGYWADVGAGLADAGAIWAENSQVFINGCHFASNLARPGRFEIPAKGGAFGIEEGTVEITKSYFVSNSVATGKGGALYLVAPTKISSSFFIANEATGEGRGEQSNGPPAAGGAVFTTQKLSVTESVFQANVVRGNPYYNTDQPQEVPPRPGYGGAIGSLAELAITNTVFFQNSAEGGKGEPFHFYFWSPYGQGGAIAVLTNAAVQLTHVTFASNTVARGPIPSETSVPESSAIFMSPTATATIRASIIGEHAAAAVKGPLIDSGWNLSADSTPNFSAPTSAMNIDARLRYPQPGFLPIISLNAGSPAIDRVTSSLSAIDVRGLARPVTKSDSGAFEREAPVPFSIQVPLPGKIRFSTATLTGEPYPVWASDDLLTWEQIGSTQGNGITPPTFEENRSAPQRFYMVRPAL